MGWACIGTSAVVESTTTSITLAEPAGVLDGDLLVACFASRSTATTAITGTGWTAVASQNNNNVVSNATTSVGSGTMLHRVRSGAPTLTFTIPAGNSVTYGRIVAYRGGTATPLDVTAAATTATNITAVSVAGLTTTQADDLIVAIIGSGRNSTMSAFNSTTPSGASGATTASGAVGTTWVERADSGSNTTPRGALGIFDVLKATAGATGNLTATMATAGGHAVVAGAFKMAPVTGVMVMPAGGTGVEKPVKVWSGTGWAPKQAKYWTGTTWKNVGVGRAWTSGGGGGFSAEAQQFIDRVTLTSTRQTIYATYIDALVAAGIWSKIDWHYKMNAPTQTIAITNLKSSSYNGTVLGIPRFSIDGGMFGTLDGNGATSYVDTGYNSRTVGQQNNVHISATIPFNGAGRIGAVIGAYDGTGTAQQAIYPRYTNENLYARINEEVSTGPANADGSGFFVATRAGGLAADEKVYRNGTLQTLSTPGASLAAPNRNVFALALNNLGAVHGSTWPVTSLSQGQNLTSTEVTAFQNAQNAFNTSVNADGPTAVFVDQVFTISQGSAGAFTYVLPILRPGVLLMATAFPSPANTWTVKVNGVDATAVSDQNVEQYAAVFSYVIPSPGVYTVVITPPSTQNYNTTAFVMVRGSTQSTKNDHSANVIISTIVPSTFTSKVIPANGAGIAFLVRPATKHSEIINATWSGAAQATSDAASGIGENNLPAIAVNHLYATSSTTFNPSVTGVGTTSYTWNYLVTWAP